MASIDDCDAADTVGVIVYQTVVHPMTLAIDSTDCKCDEEKAIRKNRWFHGRLRVVGENEVLNTRKKTIGHAFDSTKEMDLIEKVLRRGFGCGKVVRLLDCLYSVFKNTLEEVDNNEKIRKVVIYINPVFSEEYRVLFKKETETETEDDPSKQLYCIFNAVNEAFGNREGREQKTFPILIWDGSLGTAVPTEDYSKLNVAGWHAVPVASSCSDLAIMGTSRQFIKLLHNQVGNMDFVSVLVELGKYFHYGTCDSFHWFNEYPRPAVQFSQSADMILSVPEKRKQQPAVQPQHINGFSMEFFKYSIVDNDTDKRLHESHTELYTSLLGFTKFKDSEELNKKTKTTLSLMRDQSEAKGYENMLLVFSTHGSNFEAAGHPCEDEFTRLPYNTVLSTLAEGTQHLKNVIIIRHHCNGKLAPTSVITKGNLETDSIKSLTIKRSDAKSALIRTGDQLPLFKDSNASVPILSLMEKYFTQVDPSFDSESPYHLKALGLYLNQELATIKDEQRFYNPDQVYITPNARRKAPTPATLNPPKRNTDFGGYTQLMITSSLPIPLPKPRQSKPNASKTLARVKKTTNKASK